MIAPLNIKIFYTLYAINDWEKIFTRHLFHISNSGLLKNTNKFIIHCFPRVDNLKKIIDKYNLYNNIEVIFEKDNFYEYPALVDLLTSYSDYNLYLHSKGSSILNTSTYKPISHIWNKYMTYFNVLCWKYCIFCLNMLDLDTIGVDKWSSQYSGNFFWTTGNHIKRLIAANCTSKIVITADNRFEAENFICSLPNGKYGVFNEKIYFFNSFNNYSKAYSKYKIRRVFNSINKFKKYPTINIE